VGDELAGTYSFLEQFTERYGPIVPLFFIGKLEDAIKEALLCPAKDRKLLAIYLHSDHTVFCNIFCSNTLCDQNVINFTSQNFVIWPWDISVKEHEKHFHETCSKHLGSGFVSSLKSLKDKFPLFLIVTRVRSTNEVVAIIEGDCSNETMIHRLMQTYELFESQRIKDERDEISRDEREKIKRDQDTAYQTSLDADKAKRQRQDDEIEQVKRAEQLEAQAEEQRKTERQNLMQRAADHLPAEPEATAPQAATSHIRFRLPSGETLQRCFFIKDKLESVLDFALSKGFFASEYKILSSWPRKDLTNEAKSLTIEQLKLYPQETLTLEQR
jgi:FAS-associated factor 2